MPFYVIGPDGARYGPTDEEELATWAREGRLRADTELEDATSDERHPASSILVDYPWPDSSLGTAVAEYPRPLGIPEPHVKRRSVWTAGLLSFLLCGAGQMYNRQVAKGFAFLFGALAVGILTAGFGGYGVTILACVDAARTARRINSGETVGPWSLF